MKPQNLARLLALACLAAGLAGGCSSVVTSRPLGEPPSADQERFTGAWLADKTVVNVAFTSNGVGRLAFVEWDEEAERFRLRRGELVAVEGRPANLLSVRFEEEDGTWTNAWLFVQYRFADDGQLLVWPPEVPVFQAAIHEGALKGEAERGQYSTTVTVTSPPPEVVTFIGRADAPPRFQYLEPLVLRRLTDEQK